MSKNNKTVAVQTSINDMAKLKIRTNKQWKKQLLKFSERLLQKITKLPVNIAVSKENIMLNASAIFWYQDNDSKKFIMLKSNFVEDNDTVIQFPFVACIGSESASMTIENAVKDLFGKPFKKTLPLDCFAADKVCSSPTVVINDDEANSQTVLHNFVWVTQITAEQAQLIRENSDKFDVVSIPEYQMQDSQVHEVHKFIYQSCLRHIHQMKFNEIFISEYPEEFNQTDSSSKILH